ncbi:serine hydrolase domain-containing protein [Flavobacterium sp.]|jgi:CubicO group peptidase (beta-lactamase class C family)|uniref:serine hydrolase domain-containing protein n=1 Tax=Flavobacterium sp. TaxID=239 RepID=UPI0037BF13D4
MKKYHFKSGFIALLSVFATVLPTPVFAQSLSEKIEALIQPEIKDKNGPGGVFMVAKKGEIIYQNAFGKANLELEVPLTTDYVFQIGSMTKQFTAVAIMMLQEQGKLNTNDLLSKYIPDFPAGDKITIHHLLTHTSGIKDFTKMKSIKDIAQKEMTPKMMVDFFKNEPVDFLPGERFDYNNSGYVVLGYLLEIISGMSYEDFIETNIFQKIGMTQSGYATDRQVILKRASGYQKKETGYVNKTVINYSVPFASGAIMSTLKDMLKWQMALNNNTLLNKENTQKLFDNYLLNNGEAINYGYGWHLKKINNSLSREHGGSIFGYKSMGVYLPNEAIYVLGFTNCDCISPTLLTQKIAQLVLENSSK